MGIEGAPKAGSSAQEEVNKIVKASLEACEDFLENNREELVFTGTQNFIPESRAAKALERVLQKQKAESHLGSMILAQFIRNAGQFGYTVYTEKKPNGKQTTILRKES